MAASDARSETTRLVPTIAFSVLMPMQPQAIVSENRENLESSPKIIFPTAIGFCFIGLLIGFAVTFMSTFDYVTAATKCQLGWVYSRETDFCYFYHNSTYNDAGVLNTYLWKTAEKECIRSNAHLVSIHSNAESRFVKGLILSSLSNPYATLKDACAYTSNYVWSGLYVENGIGRWTDETPDDFFNYSIRENVLYSMCHGSLNRQASLMYYSVNLSSVQARFVCKKAAAT